MTNTQPSLNWLADPAVFAVNRLPAHSDHVYYETMEEAKRRSPMKLRHSLNGDWKFNYSINPSSRPEDFYKLSFDSNSWGDITVPGHMQLQGYGNPHYVNTMYPWDGHNDIRPPEIPTDFNPVGSYVKTFTLPSQMVSKRVCISFQGVETAFFVWLNGEFVGYSEDSFTPADFDLTSYLLDGENKLAVEVYQRSTGSWLEDQDFWRFSGIFRDVYLYTVPDIHVFDADIRAELDATFTKGTLNADMTFLKGVPEKAKVVGELYDRAGQLVASSNGELKNKSGQLLIHIDNPELWSAEQPYLYTLYLQIFNESGDLVEVVPHRIGFRRFELINKVMHINGKRIIFKGVNRHEFNCYHGRTVSKEDMIWDIKTMKQHNMNAVRTSHYPNHSLWYELCDEYGLYVIDEMNLETHGSWQKMGVVEPSWNIPGSNSEWEDIVMDRAISMYERDKNHPSIIIWSVGNESYVGDVLLHVARYFRQVDSGRLVHYEGVFYDRAYSETSDMESRMYAKPADIEAYLNDNPDKPYISCEYMHAMGNSVGGMYKYTDLEKKYPMYQGGFIWDYIDQSLIKKDRYGKEFLAYGGDYGDRPTDYNFCVNGLILGNRKLTPKMQEVKFLYQNIKLNPDEASVAITNDNLFIDTSDYYLEYTMLHEGEEIYRGKLDVVVEPLTTKQVELTWPDGLTVQPGEYCIHTSFKLKEATLWADAGHEVAFGQLIFKVAGADVQVSNKPFRVVHGDINLGVHGDDFTVMFSKQMGSLVSIKYAGREMISFPPAPLFWRATTDNDRGNGQPFRSNMWFAASFARHCVGFDVQEGETSVDVTFTYKLAVSAEVEVRITYSVYGDGSIGVNAEYEGAENLPQMPTFAVSFKVPADYDTLEWYAMGPEENYIDRCSGARLGIFKNKVVDNVTPYSIPQESGNRTGVRRVNVTNEKGHGLQIAAAHEPLECTITPYTALELENAYHHYELPNVHHTVITVAGRQMGVGGDDSWGAPVHDEYLIQANQKLAFSFVIRRV
ncbi:DUF4981 domain-containing protein [Bacillus sp. HMF5848]|uniref:glycoside hydrolase family 2 TIM barrel-domain containing protein n=1 Tax=Bacillus sp. HMF5848 TaxID=2495421 RepID=UPI000F7A501A|nr:glycoside hydrolase family 2 TIM barrel-domain containing protein [Bacillus sp. HMF5848]RSK29106.1 DUF4981 domain-containing protein [Bacillus sp. HMF5848]